MNEELDYAEMLEIPVETVTVRKRERRRKTKEADLSDRVVDKVNESMGSGDPAYAESTPIEREVRPAHKQRTAKRILMGELIAVVALCATIFLTNIFLTDSAINTFVRGLFRTEQAATDSRVYSDFTLSPVVNADVGTEIAVSSTGVLSFTAQCSVYSPCAGTVASVNGNEETGYSMEIRHSDSFSTIVSGLTYAYLGEGERVYSNIPIGYSEGESEVRVMFYQDGALLNRCVVGEDGLAWS